MERRRRASSRVLDAIGIRLRAQRLVPADRAPLEVARALLAMQGQDAFSANWSLGVRTNATLAAVQDAFDRGELVRSWPVRGTLHVHAAEDLPWLAALLGPRVIETTARRRAQLDLDERTLARARDVALGVLERGAASRASLLGAWTKAKIEVGGQRGYHLLFHLGVLGVICLGPHLDGEPAFVAVDRWIRRPRVLEGDAALRELALRYFDSHGPAPEAELAAWAKLRAADARRALALARPELEARTVQGRGWLGPRDASPAPRVPLLLPGFDEWVLGYRDRGAILAPAHAERIVPGGNGIFQPTLVLDGRVIGTWRRRAKARGWCLSLEPFGRTSRAERAELEAAAGRLGAFLGAPLELAWAK